MKTTFYFLFVFVLLFNCILSFAQEDEKQKYISPVIEDSLDKDERDFYKLFPNVKDFVGSVFYIEQDSRISAKVYFQEDGQLKNNTYENYMAGLQNFNRYLEQIDKISASTPGGKEVTVYLKNENVLSGELITVRQNSILIFPVKSDINLIDDSDLITVLNKSEILKIEKPNDRNFFDNCLISSYTGGAIGGLLTGGVALIVTKNKSETNYAGALISLIGWVVGTVITYIIISGDNEYEINRDYDWSDIREYARFKSFEPFYLKQTE
jgi:hypothetical protein